MSVVTLGDVELHVQRMAGWDLPQFATPVRILSDGSSANNEVIQAGAPPRRRATIQGWLTDVDDVATLDAYNGSKEVVTFSEDADARGAIVLDFQIDRTRPWFYQVSLTLIEADASS